MMGGAYEPSGLGIDSHKIETQTREPDITFLCSSAAIHVGCCFSGWGLNPSQRTAVCLLVPPSF